MSHSTKTQSQFLTLRAQGLSYDAIARQLHVSKHTLLKWAKDLQPRIDALIAAQLQAVLEKYQLTLVQRVEFLAQQVHHIQEAIPRYDLKSTYTIRIFNLLLKLHNALSQFDPNPANIYLTGAETPPESSDIRTERLFPSSNDEPETTNDELPSSDSTEPAPSAAIESEILNSEPSITNAPAETNPPDDLNSTKTAPELIPLADPSDSTISAPPSNSEPGTLNAEPNSTKTPPEPPVPASSLPIQNPKTCPESFEGSKIQNSSAAQILKFIDQYRNHFKTDPPEHVFRHLENVRKEMNRRAS